MQHLVIEAGGTERQYWRDLWRYRELFYFLAWRDILVRYKQTVIGVAWSVLRPVLTMAVLSVVFGRVAKLPSGDVPYPLMVFCGLLPWHFFATALTESSNSLVANSNMISKVYFPRLVVPAGSVITSLVDLMISIGLLALLLVFYGIAPSPQVVALPVFIVLAFGAAFGVGLWVSALMVRYRDFRYVIPFVVQFGLYLSPVGFSSTFAAPHILPQGWELLYWLNPMAGVIDGFRWAILGGAQVLNLPGLLLSAAVILVMLLAGLRYFRRTEQTFADII